MAPPALRPLATATKHGLFVPSTCTPPPTSSTQPLTFARKQDDTLFNTPPLADTVRDFHAAYAAMCQDDGWIQLRPHRDAPPRPSAPASSPPAPKKFTPRPLSLLVGPPVVASPSKRQSRLPPVLEELQAPPRASLNARQNSNESLASSTASTAVSALFSPRPLESSVSSVSSTPDVSPTKPRSPVHAQDGDAPARASEGVLSPAPGKRKSAVLAQLDSLIDGFNDYLDTVEVSMAEASTTEVIDDAHYELKATRESLWRAGPAGPPPTCPLPSLPPSRPLPTVPSPPPRSSSLSSLASIDTFGNELDYEQSIFDAYNDALATRIQADIAALTARDALPSSPGPHALGPNVGTVGRWPVCKALYSTTAFHLPSRKLPQTRTFDATCSGKSTGNKARRWMRLASSMWGDKATYRALYAECAVDK